MKRILFLLLTSVLPMAASLPPDIDPRAVADIQTIKNKGMNFKQHVTAEYYKKKLHYLNNLVANKKVNENIIPLYFGTNVALQDIRNDQAKKTTEPQVKFDSNVPAHYKPIITALLKQQNFYLPIQVAMDPKIGPFNCYVKAGFSLNIKNCNDISNLPHDFNLIMRAGLPVARLFIGSKIANPDFIFGHEMIHVANFDSQLAILVFKNAINPEELLQDPDWKNFSKLDEENADALFAIDNTQLIPSAAHFLKQADKVFPPQIDHPSFQNRHDSLCMIAQLKKAENFINAKNSYNSYYSSGIKRPRLQ